MPLIVNTNIQSLNAQRNLSKTLTPLQTAMQRLSSGLRINSAKDDAAGLAIATRMDSQMRGIEQAIRNANDAVSLVQTAEGAIDEMTNALQRMRELSVQSANGSNTALDRQATDQEVQQLIQEIDRISTQTQFNSQTLLDGTLGTKAFQVGANAGQTINVTMSQSLRSNAIGQIATATGAVTAATWADGGLTVAIGSAPAVSITGPVADATITQRSTDSAWAKAQAINTSGVAGLTVTATNAQTNRLGDTTAGTGQTYTLTVNDVSIYAATDISSAVISASAIAAQINLYSTQTGVSAAYDSGSGNVTLTAADGRNIITAQSFGGGASGGLNAALVGTLRGSVSLSASDNITMTGAFASLGLGATIAKDSSTISGITVQSADAANDAMKRIDSALSVISSTRATLGATLNRFSSTTSNLSNVLENITAAHSRIMDADFAAESANITKSQILQQAGISVLAQANTSTQSVLALLQKM